MKRFSPYTKYKINGETRCVSVGPDGEKKDSAAWLDDRINEIRHIFLTKNKNDQYEFRKKQPEIIASILSGNDTFVILPTGGGKSLCFQAPSVFFPGITLVITPLTALIRDQADRFNRNSYPVYHPYAQNFYENLRFKAIYPGMDNLSIPAMFSEIQNPRKSGHTGREIQYKFLYVSPERLCNPKFLRALTDAEQQGLRINHVVIDEVHCMSQWGFEFRESYLYIPGFIEQRPVRPIISAFTATATPRDIREIKNLLRFPEDKNEYAKKKYHEVFLVEKRENLSLHVIKCSDFDTDDTENDAGAEGSQNASSGKRINTLTDILCRDIERVCIIYRTTTSGVDELYDILSENALLKDRIVKYHAQMTESHRERSKREFGSKNIMIATKAFGMGIDIKNVSLIIHYDIPRSLEDYYQEVGRAGRDVDRKSAADCYLLYSAGPKKEKGTLQYTIGWVTSEGISSEAGCMPVSSRFSDGLKKHIYFWSYYRLCYVMAYCNIAGKYPDSAHNFIINYLRNTFTTKQAVRAIDYFYDYIVGHYPVPPAEKELFISNCLFSGADAAGFLDSCAEETDPQTEAYHAEIKGLVNEVNELHINNTHMANLLRHHPDVYQLNHPYVLSMEAPDSGQEWKSTQNKTVKGNTSSALRRADIREDAAFLFVSDPADCEEYVNVAWKGRRNQNHTVSVIFTVNYHHVINGVFKVRNNRWCPFTSPEDLSPYERYLGRHVKGIFPRKQYSGWRSTKRSSKNPGTPEAISNTDTDNLFAYVSGAKKHELTFTIHGKEKPSYFDMCVLDAIYSIEVLPKETVYVQTVWEVLTGQNPDCSTHEKLAFRRAVQSSIDKMRALTVSISDSQCGFEIKNEVFLPLKDKPKGQKGYSFPAIPPLFLYAEEMNGQIIKVPVSLLNMAKIKSRAHSLRPSADNASLGHYLIHRTSISKNRKRGNYILFSTVRSILQIREDACLFHEKAIAIMNRFQNSGFLHSYYLYITDYPYRLTDGSIINDNAYFKAEDSTVTKYGLSQDSDDPSAPGFTMTWSSRYNERLKNDNSNFKIKTELTDALHRDGRKLSASAKKELAAVPAGRMDGIVLRH